MVAVSVDPGLASCGDLVLALPVDDGLDSSVLHILVLQPLLTAFTGGLVWQPLLVSFFWRPLLAAFAGGLC